MTTVPAVQSLEYFQLTTTSARLIPGTPLEECAEGLAGIEVRKDATYWWIGDLLNQARDLYGEDWSQLVEEEKATTYRQYMWLAKAVPEDLRYTSIPYSWYREARNLDVETLSRLLSEATDSDGARLWEYRQWHEAIAEATDTVPRERRTAKQKAEDAIGYARRKEGQKWSHEDTITVIDLLK